MPSGRSSVRTTPISRREARACLAIVHPVNSAGSFSDDSSESPFVIDHAYLGERRYAEALERGGLEITFRSVHRPLEAYGRALEEAGFLVEAIREPAAPPGASGSWGVESVEQWRRLPMFLWLRAART